MTRPADNDIDSVAPFQKAGAVAANVMGSHGLVHEMLRYPEELRRAHALLMEREGIAGLTARQHELLTFVRQHIGQGGKAPTYQQMADGIGLASKQGIHRLILALEERGHLTRIPGRRQSIALAERAA